LLKERHPPAASAAGVSPADGWEDDDECFAGLTILLMSIGDFAAVGEEGMIVSPGGASFLDSLCRVALFGFSALHTSSNWRYGEGGGPLNFGIRGQVLPGGEACVLASPPLLFGAV